jgi:hypothetical protein
MASEGLAVLKEQYPQWMDVFEDVQNELLSTRIYARAVKGRMATLREELDDMERKVAELKGLEHGMQVMRERLEQSVRDNGRLMQVVVEMRKRDAVFQATINQLSGVLTPAQRRTLGFKQK